MKIFCLTLVLFVCSLFEISAQIKSDKECSGYLFAYFTGDGKNQEAVHYAVSYDGYEYYALNGNQPVLESEAISSTGGVRDPHILRSEDGKTFYMVATDMVSANGWDSNRAMVLMTSNDLINWKHTVLNIQKRFEGHEQLKRVWAPQTIYDKEAGKYMIYWSMKHGNGPDIIYYSYANNDFTDIISEPKPLFLPSDGKSCIDGDIVIKDGKYYLFYKTEGHGNGIKVAITQSLTSGIWNEIPGYRQQTSEAVEGACAFKIIGKNKYILMYDVYMKGHYQFTESDDLVNFKAIDHEIKMDFKPRHGSVIPVTDEELNKLFAEWGEPASLSNMREARKVREIIINVNNHWQKNNSPKVRSFWDNAAYHTGNMEAYHLIGDRGYLEYSEAWADYNEWKGAKSDNRSEWKYSYGETDDYVLFGDYQVCFQTYLDLYNIKPDDYKIRRAREVMEYQMSTPKNDYWWWSDGLYMVMPVMTKLYKLTHNRMYLDKLYEYIQYSDRIMFDKDENLYYRDAKYVYPKHKSVNGRKDFWARGDGWVLAGLAKVLKDLPEDYVHYDFFLKKFKDMASAVAAVQQPEGYWTRSMMDPEHAPGPETSGTAFFTYGILWGVNNGILDKDTYLPVISRSWKYLAEVAYQNDGTVGFVQPIGEKAIPGQILDSRSTANFGVGAFLLAACEYVRFLESSSVYNDRAYWCELAYKMAAPILSNMAKGELQKNMIVEISPTWDGRDKGVTYMEAFGRLMAGIAPWLALPDDESEEGRMRKQLREWALKSYKNAVDPNSEDYLYWNSGGQPLVDAAYIAESFHRAYEQLWLPLDETTRKRYIDEFKKLRRVDPPYTNWLLFSSTIESFLAKADADYDPYRVSSAVRKVEEWYVGDGWYADGEHFAFDYYSSYVFHSMYLETLQAMIGSGKSHNYISLYNKALRRAQKYSIILERFISPEGTFPVFGRSIGYRLGALQPLALMAWYQELPAGLSNGQVRSALTAVMKRMFTSGDNFNEGGFLNIGFTGHQPDIADWYTNNGSLYLTSLVFSPLGLPASHPFWTDASQDWTSKRAWNGKPFIKDHYWSIN